MLRGGFKGPSYMKYGYLAMLLASLGSLVIAFTGWPAASESLYVAALLGLLGSLWLLSAAFMAAGVRYAAHAYILLSFLFLQWRFLYTHEGETVYEWLFWAFTATVIFFASSVVAVKWWRSINSNA